MQEIIFSPQRADLIRQETIIKSLPVSEEDLRIGYIGVNFFTQTNLFRFGYRKAFITRTHAVNVYPALIDAESFHVYREYATVRGILTNLTDNSKIYLFRTHQELYKWLSE